MDILITDVTEMHASNYCVAGWDADGGRMIRPLPGGSNWTGHLLAAHGILCLFYRTFATRPSGPPLER
jgi:hypothetical protein